MLKIIVAAVGFTMLLALQGVEASELAGEKMVESFVVTGADIHNTLPVRQLSMIKEAHEANASPMMRQIFAWFFPFGPAWNSILATFYISSVPNFILAFIPAQISSNTLNTMTAFATGGLLSDVFLHLVPHSFMGEPSEGDDGVRFVMVEEKRNILVGLGIFIGFASFFVMEKTLRVLGGGEDSHGHAHEHSHSHGPDESAAHSSAIEEKNKDGLRARGANPANGDTSKAEETTETVHQTSKLSAYLNLFGDFVHNITDGLAMAASFYSSPLIGATTALACFAHEIPHEIADYSILVRSGFTKGQAMKSQFLTAVGAFIGTFMGIGIHNLSNSTEESGADDLGAAVRQAAAGILGTTVSLGDLVIPFVAGGFMYIGAVAVLPTLLAESKSVSQALREFGAMAFGVLCMFLVA
ncbi:ZIP-like iron-zinc transporter [Punctularia strigosozonata HHB-11173 SS5]|uniref:ZIP-like iron-zinc transporter n=1 Tax=Punctularia strigosozonata (strain HHB-11173) TaxID=741275 RepID=R7S2P6_PUNST|nr:ZIP-like iron-zinc transporter [Punctularia strigosozonata HHB-11173 SS5]EIN04062.1 ZIP-like iron-zinc transporter [Punctularia strigosozonata HHB-11173 SS5]